MGGVSGRRLKEAQENIKKITADKRVETKKINANSLVSGAHQRLTSPALELAAAESLVVFSPTEREAATEGIWRLLQLSRPPSGGRTWCKKARHLPQRQRPSRTVPSIEPRCFTPPHTLIHSSTPRTRGCVCSTADTADMTSVSKAKGRSPSSSAA